MALNSKGLPFQPCYTLDVTPTPEPDDTPKPVDDNAELNATGDRSAVEKNAEVDATGDRSAVDKNAEVDATGDRSVVDKNAEVDATGSRLKSMDLGDSPEPPSDARDAIRQVMASASRTNDYLAEPPRKRARTESPPASTPSKGKAVRFDIDEDEYQQKQQQQKQQRKREKRKRQRQRQKQQKQQQKQQQQAGSHCTTSPALDETDPALIPTPSPERGPPKSFSPFTPRSKSTQAKSSGSSTTPTETSNMQRATSATPTTTAPSNVQRATSSAPSSTVASNMQRATSDRDPASAPTAASTTDSTDAANSSAGGDNNNNNEATPTTDSPTPNRASADPQPPADPRPPVQPHQLVERALHHLDNLRDQLAHDEHEASRREDRLLQLLRQARQLRAAATQWRRDGMVVIRDRERNIQRMRGMTPHEIVAVPGWVELLKPLMLGVEAEDSAAQAAEDMDTDEE